MSPSTLRPLPRLRQLVLPSVEGEGVNGKDDLAGCLTKRPICDAQISQVKTAIASLEFTGPPDACCISDAITIRPSEQARIPASEDSEYHAAAYLYEEVVASSEEPSTPPAPAKVREQTC
ncbi:hypothetical protein ONZ45_g14261 [Pleurotus djamor]|nr:hypothetical protein ONZ45_g14261 [Pleurotus djamor]